MPPAGPPESRRPDAPPPEPGLVEIRVLPNAPRTALAGAAQNAIRIRLQAPPVDGKANAALVLFLAKTLGVPRRAVEIVSGLTGRSKRVRVAGLEPAEVRRRLGAA